MVKDQFEAYKEAFPLKRDTFVKNLERSYFQIDPLEQRREASSRLLACFDAFCVEHEIPYFLISDTLLGAELEHDYLSQKTGVEIGLRPQGYKALCEAVAGLETVGKDNWAKVSDELFISLYFADKDGGLHTRFKPLIRNYAPLEIDTVSEDEPEEADDTGDLAEETSEDIATEEEKTDADEIQVITDLLGQPTANALFNNEGDEEFDDDSTAPLDVEAINDAIDQSDLFVKTRIKVSIFTVVPAEPQERYDFLNEVRELEREAKRAQGEDIDLFRSELFTKAFTYETSVFNEVMCVLGSRGQAVPKTSLDNLNRTEFHGIETWIPGGITPWTDHLEAGYACRETVEDALLGKGHNLVISAFRVNKVAGRAFNKFKDSATKAFRQDAQAHLLTLFDEFCAEHGLSYFLIGRTLQGALVHNDFLPNRSRLEVGMLKDSYFEFLRVANEYMPRKLDPLKSELIKQAQKNNVTLDTSQLPQFSVVLMRSKRSNTPRRVLRFQDEFRRTVIFDGKTVFDRASLPKDVRAFIEISLFSALPNDPQEKIAYFTWMRTLNKAYEKAPRRLSESKYRTLKEAALQYEYPDNDREPALEVARVMGARSIPIPMSCAKNLRSVLLHGVKTWAPAEGTAWDLNLPLPEEITPTMEIDSEASGFMALSPKEADLVRTTLGDEPIRSLEYNIYKEAVVIDAKRDALAQMLASFDKFCNEHEVKYFLFSDTLQGADAYCDFIPGAAKLQIGLLYPEYLKLRDICNDPNEVHPGAIPWTISFYIESKPDWPRRLPLIRSAFPIHMETHGQRIPHTIRPSIELSIFTSVTDDYLTKKTYFVFMKNLNGIYSARSKKKPKRRFFAFRKKRRSFKTFVKETAAAFLPKKTVLDQLFKEAEKFEDCDAPNVTRFLGSRTKVVSKNEIGNYRRVMFHGVETWAPEFETEWEGEPLDTATPELKELQEVAKQIVSEIHRVCKELGIGYFVCGGTMLGYLRHGGFIPWDDDIDVGMLREDYERFKAEAPAIINSDKFFLQTRASDPKIPYLFSKVRMNGTSYITEYNKYRDFHKGICVDIFPFDAVPNDTKELRSFKKKVRKIEAKHNKTVNRQYPKGQLLSEDTQTKRNPFYYFAHAMGGIYALIYWSIPLKRTQKAYDKIVQTYNDVAERDNLEYVASFVPSYTMVKKSDLLPYREVEFEDIKVNMMAHPEIFLRMQYGLYMLMPEPHQRVGHPLLEWDTGMGTEYSHGGSEVREALRMANKEE